MLDVIGLVTYRLKFPSMVSRAHNLFQVSKLKLFHCSEGTTGPIPVFIDADGAVGHEVEYILDKTRQNRSIYFLFQFTGDSESEVEWIPDAHLGHCKDVINEF